MDIKEIRGLHLYSPIADLKESLTNLRDELALSTPLAVIEVNSKMLNLLYNIRKQNRTNRFVLQCPNKSIRLIVILYIISHVIP